MKPATPLSALEPYRELLDIVMIMTVEPGFGGQSFMTDAATKILPAHEIFRDRAADLPGGQVHVDGGVNRHSAELCGGLGADVLVAGSTLWKKGVDIARQMRLLRALADEGYANGVGRGEAGAGARTERGEPRERRSRRGPGAGRDGGGDGGRRGTDGASAGTGAQQPHTHLGRRNDRLLLAAVASYAVLLSILMIARGISVTPELIVVAFGLPRCCSVAESSSCATGSHSWPCSSPTS